MGLPPSSLRRKLSLSAPSITKADWLSCTTTRAPEPLMVSTNAMPPISSRVPVEWGTA